MAYFKIITLGCKVNQYESVYISEELIKRAWKPQIKDSHVDLVIINTCIVTQKASHQSRQEIRKALRENPNAKIVVTGCYSQVYPEELKEIKGVSLIIGNKYKTKIPELIESTIHRKNYVITDNFSKKELFQYMPISRFDGKTRAFLKIQDGCESFCSYCIIPYARGPYRSLNINNVLTAIEHLIDKGYKEIVLTGIHLGKYGIDNNTSLESLLNEIGKNKYPVRIRLSSIEPNEISDGLIDMIASEDWICKHLHIPLQSGDNRILSRMKRRYTREDFCKLIMKIYNKIPFIGIGVDVMTGFPGENLTAHQNTMSLLIDLPISYLHVFPYSDRPKTSAFYFNNKLSPKIKKIRAKELREIGHQKRREFLKKCLGKMFWGLVEKDLKNGILKAVTDNYITVILQNNMDITGKLVIIKLQKLDQHNMAFGEIYYA